MDEWGELAEAALTPKYRIEACAVCGERLLELSTSVTCPKCGTVYDLLRGRVDNSKTRVAPIDCKHRKRLLVQSASGSGQEETVTVCADCGEIQIYGRTAERRDPFHVRIVLWSLETANAVRRAALMIDQPGNPIQREE